MEPAFDQASSFDDDALRLARAAVSHVDGATHASVVMVGEDEIAIVATTDSRMSVLDTEPDGPTTEAVKSGRIVRVPTVSRNSEFPRYVRICRSLGVNSVAAFPIKEARSTTIGALTITSEDHHGFGTADLRTGRGIADELAAAHSRAQDVEGVEAR